MNEGTLIVKNCNSKMCNKNINAKELIFKYVQLRTRKVSKLYNYQAWYDNIILQVLLHTHGKIYFIPFIASKTEIRSNPESLFLVGFGSFCLTHLKRSPLSVNNAGVGWVYYLNQLVRTLLPSGIIIGVC